MNFNYSNNNQRNGYNRNQYQQRPQQTQPKLHFEPLNKVTYVKQAEDVIKNLSDKANANFKYKVINSNQIRLILSLITEIFIDVKMDKNPVLNEDYQSRIQYCKMKIAYQAGRSDTGDVRDFVNQSNIMGYLDEVKDSREKFMLVAHYMESLVAYHKFYCKG